MIFVDCEASSLSAFSYPIEVALAFDKGPTERLLIDPSSMRNWNDWSEQAQGIHGYSRDELTQKGEPAIDVAIKLSPLLEGQTLYSDNPEADLMRLNKLFKDTGVTRPRFEVAQIISVINSLWEQIEPDRHRRGERLMTIRNWARGLHQPAHKAENDAKYLRRLYRYSQELTSLTA